MIGIIISLDYRLLGRTLNVIYSYLAEQKVVVGYKGCERSLLQSSVNVSCTAPINPKEDFTIGKLLTIQSNLLMEELILASCFNLG